MVCRHSGGWQGGGWPCAGGEGKTARELERRSTLGALVAFAHFSPPSCLAHARYLAGFYFALFNGLYRLCGLLTGSGQASSDETLPVGAVKAAGDFMICN